MTPTEDPSRFLVELIQANFSRSYRARDALRKLGEDALPAVLQALSSPHPEQHLAALTALPELPKLIPPTLSTLLTFLDSSSDSARRKAIEVSKLAPSRQVVDAALRASRNPEPKIRRDAFRLLLDLEQKHPDRGTRVLEGLHDDCWRIRERAVLWLATHITTQVLEALRELARTETHPCVLQALEQGV